jgi:hypothetical protein
MIAASLSMREQHQLMQRVLQREHARADRSGKGFSLVVLHIDRLAAHRAVRRLFDAIHQRARLTDEIGWLDNDRLAILLPETNDVGAQQFMAHLRELRQYSAVMPRLSVYVYPTTPAAVSASPAAVAEIDATTELPIRLEIPAPSSSMEAAWQQ